MCAPAFIPLAIALVSAMSQNRDQKAQYATNQLVADQDLAENTKALAEQRGQIKAKAADEMSERARVALIERGRLRAIAGDSGVTGNSQQRVEDESRFLEGQDLSAIEMNRENALKQNTRNVTAAQLDAQRQKLGVAAPSLLGAGLQIAGAAAKTYAATKKPTNADANSKLGRTSQPTDVDPYRP
jgi:hypothetical protein